MARMEDTQRPVSRDGRESPEGNSVKVASGLNVVTALWLIAAPFLLAYAGITAAVWNDILIGITVLILAGIRVAKPERNAGLSWTNLVLGLWLIAAPFVLSYAGTAAALWNDVIVGVVVASLATWSALATPR